MNFENYKRFNLVQMKKAATTYRRNCFIIWLPPSGVANFLSINRVFQKCNQREKGQILGRYFLVVKVIKVI